MRTTFLAFSPPFLGEEEIDEVVDTLHSDWITTGPKVKRFESDFAQFIGAPAALAVSSATDAMQVALVALGVGSGDEVIPPHDILLHGSRHRACGGQTRSGGCGADTLNIDPRQVAAAVTPRTRAILPVHLYGHPCDMDRLFEIAEKHNLVVVEDAAHALPAVYKGRMVGTMGALTAFSFYATKNMTTAEGGMLTGAAELIDRARPWSLHGMSKDAYNRYRARKVPGIMRRSCPATSAT